MSLIRKIVPGLMVLFVLASCSVAKNAGAQTADSNLLKALRSISEIKEIVVLEPKDHFNEYYELYFEQHTDPFDTTSPVFLQKIRLSHVSFDSPVIVDLEGYDMYFDNAGELPSIFDANQITVEHRYFGNSVPKGDVPWETLTVRNAARDHHRIITALKKLYPKSAWLTTGISKGGQTALIHRSFYPDDVEASVCYVAPLNSEREDPRIHAFLESVGTAEQRERIREFQLLCLRRKNELVLELEKKMKEEGWSWDFPPSVALDYYVLEYSFAFWQWGNDFEKIPGESASASELLEQVLYVSGVSFFEKEGVRKLRPYFYAAMTEMGIYDYDTTHFSKYLSKDTYNFEFTMPAGMEKAFSPEPMRRVNAFVQNDARKILFVYGGQDPWSATAVNLPEDAAKKELFRYILPGGDHRTRITSFDFSTRQEIAKILRNWLGILEAE